jgi:hypothetical protein
MILDDDESDEADTKDEAEDTSGADAGHIKRDASPLPKATRLQVNRI